MKNGTSWDGDWTRSTGDWMKLGRRMDEDNWKLDEVKLEQECKSVETVTLCRPEMPERPIRLCQIMFKGNCETYLFIP